MHVLWGVLVGWRACLVLILKCTASREVMLASSTAWGMAPRGRTAEFQETAACESVDEERSFGI